MEDDLNINAGPNLPSTSKDAKHASPDTGPRKELDVSDWKHEDMEETTMATIRDLFELLDQSNSKVITADNLYDELRSVGSNITRVEVQKVFKNMRRDARGHFNFDKFLYHMTHVDDDGTQTLISEETRKEKSAERLKLLYCAITQFSIKQTLADIEKTFRRRMSDAISNYTSGLKGVGIGQNQLNPMGMTNNMKDSPYSKPCVLVHWANKPTEKKKSPKGKTRKLPDMAEMKSPGEDPGPSQSDEFAEINKQIKHTVTMIAQAEKEGSVENTLCVAKAVVSLRKKLDFLTDLSIQKPSKGQQVKPADFRAYRDSSVDMKLVKRKCQRNPSHIYRIDKDKNKDRKLECKLCIEYRHVPLPKVDTTINGRTKNFTFDDVLTIRKRAEDAIANYYHMFQLAEMKSGLEHWDRCYRDLKLKRGLLERFRLAYGTYTPFRQQDCFVETPWTLGAFNFPPKSTTQGKHIGLDIGLLKNPHENGIPMCRQSKQSAPAPKYPNICHNRPTPVPRPISSAFVMPRAPSSIGPLSRVGSTPANSVYRSYHAPSPLSSRTVSSVHAYK